jgi:hypothetical protein
VLDAQEPRAETAVVGQYTIDAHTCRAGGGTFIGGHTWRPT